MGREPRHSVRKGKILDETRWHTRTYWIAHLLMAVGTTSVVVILALGAS